MTRGLGEPVCSVEHARGARDASGESACYGLGRNDRDLGGERRDLLGQPLDAVRGRQGDHGELETALGHDLEGLAADRPGRAEQGQSFHAIAPERMIRQ
jgi:hypothetical protein